MLAMPLPRSRPGQLFCWNRCSSRPTQRYPKSRDIPHCCFHISGVSPLKEPALNAFAGDFAALTAQVRAQRRVMSARWFVAREFHRAGWLQARWFAGDFVKRSVSTDGDQSTSFHSGVWNREAGPDFRDSDPESTGGEPIHGGIEIDVRGAAGIHGHATIRVPKRLRFTFVNKLTVRFFPLHSPLHRNVPTGPIDPLLYYTKRSRKYPTRTSLAIQAPRRICPRTRPQCARCRRAIRLRQTRSDSQQDPRGMDATNQLFQEIARARYRNKFTVTLLTHVCRCDCCAKL